MGSSAQAQTGFTLKHESSSTVNMGRQGMDTEAVKWVDVVEGAWRNSYCLTFLSEVGRKSTESG